MRSGQRTNLAPDRTNLGRSTAVETFALVEHGTAHSLLLYIVVVTVNHCGYLIHLDTQSLGALGHVLGFLGLEVFADLREHCLAVVLVGVSARSLSVSAGVAEVMNGLLQLIVVHLVAILAFNLFAVSFHHLELSLALRLDSLVCGADSVEHNRFGHFLHLTLNHHDVVERSGHNKLEVGMFALLEGRVDHKLSVHASHAYLRYRTLERDVRAGQGSRSSQTGNRLRHVNAVSRIQSNVHKRVCVVISGEEGT